MSNRINPNQIKAELDRIIADASDAEPQLAERLRQFSRWIKDKKPGLLTKKRLVVDLLIEIILSSDVWLKLKDLSPEERTELFGILELSPPEIYWYEILFPKWFRATDPKLTVWTRKIMSEEFPRSDEEFIKRFIIVFTKLKAPTFYNYILDLSMATDLIISHSREKPLAVQLTISNQTLLKKKQADWEETLRYWKIERGVLFSQSPNHSIDRSSTSLLNHSDELEDNCYIVSVSEE